MAIHKRLLVVPVLLASSFVFAGCYAETGTTTVTSADVVADDGYEPAYYDGYVVYYDDVGRPYYYDRGAVIWVSPGSPHYAGLVHHWHVYGPAYRRWNARSGPRYHEVRRAPGYHSYHGYRGEPHRR